MQRIMRRLQLVIAILMFVSVVYGQTHSSADKLFQSKNYSAALEQYGALLKSYPSNPLYLYRYARCAQELGDDATAIKYFTKSGDRYNLKDFYIAESYLRLWHVKEAIAAYNTYQEKEPDERHDYVQKQIARAELLQRYLRRVERLQILDSVQVPLDSLLYSHRRKPRLSNEAGKLSYDSLGQIVYTNQRQDRRIWTTNVDSSFILVSSHRLLEGWTTPDTLPGNINFTQQQSAPFVLSDGLTIYFAANDTNGLGGLDIYVSRYNTSTETYTTPENIGMPYNSPANEYLFVMDEINHIGYLATDRFAEAGYAHIYTFIIPEHKQYWKNIPTDSLIAYAQLQCFEQGIIEDVSAVSITHRNIESNEFFFIINDSTIYRSINDFRNPKAKEKFVEWQSVNKQITEEQQLINELRLQYTNADETQQKTLTPTILRLENNRSQLLERSQSLLQEIRAEEITIR